MGVSPGEESLERRRCGSDDRGVAGLRSDQAINEATCVRVLNRNLSEKTWLISVWMRKRSEWFGVKKETTCRKRRHCQPMNSESEGPHHRIYVDRAEIGAAC